MISLYIQEENAGLAKDLQHSVDQAATMFEKAIKQEMKCEKLEACIKEYEDRIEYEIFLIWSVRVVFILAMLF